MPRANCSASCQCPDGTLLAIYALWPFYGLCKLANAIASKNVAVVAELVDLRSLRSSIGQQIAETYLRLHGTNPGSLSGRIAAGVGTAFAEAMLNRLVTPEGLIDLLQGARTDLPTPADLGL